MKRARETRNNALAIPEFCRAIRCWLDRGTAFVSRDQLCQMSRLALLWALIALRAAVKRRVALFFYPNLYRGVLAYEAAFLCSTK